MAGSLAERAGIRPGDVITAINGEPLTDLIDYRFLVCDTAVAVKVDRAGSMQRFLIEKDEDEGLGITFTDAVFDGIRRCRNSCVFCFIHQMPPGLRPTLYVEDDDYRLSITHGSYVSLTNMSEADFKRVIALHLSPLHVSVHATDPETRVRLLRNKRAAMLPAQMQRLAKAGIEMHCQIVLCPGLNDGAVLDQTLADLSKYYPSVLSVAVVPVGLTRCREGLTPLQPVDAECSRRILAQVEGWRERFRKELGTRFVFPADEFYLQAGAAVPSRATYEDFPQTEDGIGMVRLFLDDLAGVKRRKPRPAAQPERILLVTGMIARPLVEALATEMTRLTGHRVECVPVVNQLFGSAVTVTGLLCGADILAALRAAGPADRIYLPDVLLNEDRFLDDMTVAELEAALETPVLPVSPAPAALARELLGTRRRVHRPRCPESEGRGLYVTNESFS